jgi:excisionase family DNA binding protein
MTVEEMHAVAGPLLEIIRRYCREAVRECMPVRRESQAMIGFDTAKVSPKGEPPMPRLALRVRDAAKALGISERTLYTWTGLHDIPHVRVGTVVLYPVDSLRDWLKQQAERTTANEVAGEQPEHREDL